MEAFGESLGTEVQVTELGHAWFSDTLGIPKSEQYLPLHRFQFEASTLSSSAIYRTRVPQ